MNRTQKDFLRYLAGLAMATAPAVPALAGQLPKPAVKDTIEFAANLKEKMPAAARAPVGDPDRKELAWWPFPRPFSEIFPEVVYVQTVYPPFSQAFIQAMTPTEPASSDQGEHPLPSEAFKTIRKS